MDAKAESAMTWNVNHRLIASYESERAVLGAALMSPDALAAAVESGLEPRDFLASGHRDIWGAILRRHSESQPIDPIIVDRILVEQLPTPGYCMWLVDQVTFLSNTAALAKDVRDLALLRRMTEEMEGIVKAAREGVQRPAEYLDGAVGRILSMATADKKPTYRDLNAIVSETMKAKLERQKSGEAISGVTTGYPDLDAVTTGWHGGEMSALAARPGMGKTTLAKMLARAAAQAGVPVLFFSLEMTDAQLSDHWISAESSVELPRLMGRWNADEWQRVVRGCGAIAKYGATILVESGSASSISKIRMLARRFAADKGIDRSKAKIPGVIIVDYLQLAEGEDGRGYENRNAEIGAVSRGLKAIAKDLNMHVIALSQLNRSIEKRADAEPMMSDLRDSGQIEQDASVITFLHYRKDDTEGTVRAIIRKNRNGPCGEVCLHFEKRYVRFNSLSRREL
jgi:replicative DNA helicase